MKKTIKQGGITIEILVNTKKVYNGYVHMEVKAEGLKGNYQNYDTIYVGNYDADQFEQQVSDAELKALLWARAQENPEWKEETLKRLGFE